MYKSDLTLFHSSTFDLVSITFSYINYQQINSTGIEHREKGQLTCECGRINTNVFKSFTSEHWGKGVKGMEGWMDGKGQ